MERKKQISVEEKEIERKDKELTATVKLKLKATKYKRLLRDKGIF